MRRGMPLVVALPMVLSCSSAQVTPPQAPPIEVEAPEPLAAVTLSLGEGSREDAALTLIQIAPLPGGDLLVGGITDGTTPLVPQATGRLGWWGFVARLTPEGEPVWVHREHQAWPALSVNSDTVTAAFLMEDGMLRATGDAPERSGSAEIVVALGVEDGAERWRTQRVLGGNPAMIWGISQVRQGDAVVVASQVSNVSLLGETPIPKSPHLDTVLSWYDAATGAHRRTYVVSGPKNTIVEGLAEAGDDVVLVGTFIERVQLGNLVVGAVEVGCGEAPTKRCGFVARMNSAGEVVWVRGVTSGPFGGAKLRHVVPHGDGFAVAGEVFHAKKLDLGKGPIDMTGTSHSTLFVFGIDREGKTTWEAVLPSSEASVDIDAMAPTSDGRLALALTWDEVPGTTSAPATLSPREGVTLRNHGGTDVVVLTLDPKDGFEELTHVDAAPRRPTEEGTGRGGQAQAFAIAERGGTLVVAGNVGGDVHRGGRALDAPPWSDGDGPRWGLFFGAPLHEVSTTR